MAPLYGGGDEARVVAEEDQKEPESYRTPWRRDYARLIHSPSFRRLQGKTQVFPGYESDFYRNRLSHSLEVAQIAKAIAIRLNATAPEFNGRKYEIQPDIVELAGLAHDLGHPPFGHNGEEALDECMQDYGGYEGNAQTLRIVARLEKKVTRALVDGVLMPVAPDHRDLRCGLNLTYRSLASLLKYDVMIPERRSDRPKQGIMKGYYFDDQELVEDIKEHVLGGKTYNGKFKTVECWIMDIADDIAYSTYDLEDNFKAGFLTPLGLFGLPEDVHEAVAQTISERAAKQYPELSNDITADVVRNVLFQLFEDVLFGGGEEPESVLGQNGLSWSTKKMLVAAEAQGVSRRLVSDGYQRVKLTSSLVQFFLSGIEVVPNAEHPQLHKIRLDFSTFLYVEVLKNLTFHAIIRSPALQVVEYRGKDIVSAIFRALNAPDGDRLLPDDFQAVYRNAQEALRMRTICDFIAGMTDRYAFEFYSRLYGTGNLTVHKPF